MQKTAKASPEPTKQIVRAKRTNRVQTRNSAILQRLREIYPNATRKQLRNIMKDGRYGR